MPNQLYAIDRTGYVWVLDPTTLASPSPTTWSSPFLQPYPGPALGAAGFDTSNSRLVMSGLAGGVASYLYAVTPSLNNQGLYFLAGAAAPISMPDGTLQPSQVAIDNANHRIYIADSVRYLTAWSIAGSPITQLAGSPYYPNGGDIKAQGVAYNANRVYTCCQTPSGQDQLVIYDATSFPMNQIAGSPVNLTLGLSQSNGDIAYDIANGRILIACSLGLVVLNATTFAPIAGSPFSTGGTDPRRLVIDTIQSRVYVANFGSNTIGALSLSTLAPISGSPYSVPGSPNALAFSPAANRLYVASYNIGTSSTITVYNPTTVPMTTVSGLPSYSIPFNSLVVGT